MMTQAEHEIQQRYVALTRNKQYLMLHDGVMLDERITARFVERGPVFKEYRTATLVPSLALVAGEVKIPVIGETDAGDMVEGTLKFWHNEGETQLQMWVMADNQMISDRVHTVYIAPQLIEGDVDEALRFELIDTEWGRCNRFQYAHAHSILFKVDNLALMQIQANAQVLFSANDLNHGRWYLPTPDEDDSRLWLGSYGEGTLKVVVPTHRPGNFSNRYFTLIHA